MKNLRTILAIILTFFILSSITFSTEAALDLQEQISVTFSPQSDMNGYLFELVSVIDSAKNTLEIALYDLKDFDVFNALKHASARGVRIRMLSESAATDRDKNNGTFSHQLESMGIDVRYVNKTLHHKFIIVDNSILVTSSGNWNVSANSIYDENTLWVKDEELVLRYRAEFELLWQNSREFGQTFAFSQNNINPESLLSQIKNLPGREAYFTSANYRTYISSVYGPTFAKISGNQVVADKIVELINQATHSIYIAANHFRSRAIAEALIAKKQENPALDIRVYLDEQEYISEEYNQIQIAEKAAALAKATTPGEIREILEKGFYYSFQLINAGIDVRFKTYSYKWHPDITELMHHKYAIFDNRIVATGSYNYSYNSETESMENLLIFDDSFAKKAVNGFRNNFNLIWETGREEGYYNDILAYINSDNRYIPVVYPAMALTYQEVRNLRTITKNVCPAVEDLFFKNNLEKFSAFPKGLEYVYDQKDRVVSVKDSIEQKFSIDYSYNDQDELTGISFQSSDNLHFQTTYGYDQYGNLTRLESPQSNLTFSFYNNELVALNTGQGTYSWDEKNNEIGSLVSFSTPLHVNYLSVQWNKQWLPVWAIDADGRSINWQYDDDCNLSTIKSSEKTISYILDDRKHDWKITSSDNSSIHYQLPGLNELTINTSGAIKASLNYSIVPQQNKTKLQTIDIISDHVASGSGKKSTIKYLFDPYNRVIEAGNAKILRQPFSGNITAISCNHINETRSYNSWEQLVNQKVTYKGQVYFEAQYSYDGLHRISSVIENILGSVATYNYHYDEAGRLATVFKNGIQIEQYTYDSWGNRITSLVQEAPNQTENYSYTDINRLSERSTQLSDSIRKTEYLYNNSGQLKHVSYKTIKDGRQWLTKERSYNYDVFGNLKKVTWASQKQEYQYDPYDRLIAKYKNDKLTNGFIYGLGNAPLAELNENGRIINTFLYADNNVPIVMKKAGADYFIVSDIRGSVRLVIKSDSGEVRQQVTYNSFGQILADTNPGYTPFGFAGGLYDYRTELTRFGVRDYAPEIGRWLSEDPIGFLGGDVNFYAYVGNDPINFIDPSGLARTGTDVFWNNGWRTSDGKFASPLGGGRPGAQAESAVWDAIKQKPGWEIRTGRVAVRDALGNLRIYDGAAKGPSGNYIGLEIKSGTASKTPYQRAFDQGVSRLNPAKGVGQSKGIQITRTLLINVKTKSY